MALSLYSLIFAVIFVVFAEAGPFDDSGNGISINLGEDCGTVIASGLTDSQINEIVNAHAANNLGQLTWSNEVAAAAQTIANQCGNSGDSGIKWNGLTRTRQIENSDRDVSFTNMVNEMLKPRSTFREHSFRTPSYRMSGWTNFKTNFPEMNFPKRDFPKRDFPKMDFPKMNFPETKSSEMNFPETKKLSEMNFPGSKFSVSDNLLSRRYRDLTGDYTNKMGCGFLETQKGKNFVKRFVCLYGPGENSNFQN